MRVKVAIIGGGFAGAATAYFLSRAGLDGIVVLEREPVCGAHASGRNAAMCRSVAETSHWTALTSRGAALLREPPPDLASAPLVTRTGGILVGTERATLDSVEAQAVAFGVAHQRLDRAGLDARWPLLSGMPAEGAVSFPDDGVIDVHGLLQGYLRASRAAGVEVMTGAEVLAMRMEGAGMELTTRERTLHADCVVIAAGAWAGVLGALAGADAPPFATLRRHLFVSARDRRVDASAPWLWHLDEGIYLRPESGAWLLSACDEDAHPPSAPEVSPVALEHLAERAALLGPGMHSLSIARSWACLRTFTPDRRPLIGWDRQLRPLFWVAGLGGHGATASGAIGELAAESILARLRPSTG
nr:FAD-binding oxidoreductase [Deltaproteobacteria bacterium]